MTKYSDGTTTEIQKTVGAGNGRVGRQTKTTNKETTMETALIKEEIRNVRESLSELSNVLRDGREAALVAVEEIERAVAELKLRVREATP